MPRCTVIIWDGHTRGMTRRTVFRLYKWNTQKAESGMLRLADARGAIESRSEPEPNSGCLLWTGRISGQGYGGINVDGKPLRAHRLAYELAHGPIPPGLTLDHLCRVRTCVNPDHLE